MTDWVNGKPVVHADAADNQRRPAALIRAAASRLQTAGLPSAVADARWLLRHVTGMSATQLLTSGPLPASTIEDYRSLIDQRAGGIPVQHLTGHAPFRNVDLEVGPGVFIPRPETELVAQAAIDAAKALSSPVVVEFCAGSGAISKSIRDEVPGATITAVEISDEALPWLQRNLADDDVDIVSGDFADIAELRPALVGGVDVLVVNPPYVPETDRAILPADVSYDPDLALFAGDDGLDVIRAIFPVANELLVPGGMLVIEHDESQRDQVACLALQSAFVDVREHDDLAGRPRYLSARRGASA